MSQFTICALFFGNYPRLAQRLINSLRQPGVPEDIQYRFGLNKVAPTTLDLVHEFAKTHNAIIYVGGPPYTKYPMMRRMFHSPPLNTRYTMWFDDDSCFTPNLSADYFARLEHCLSSYDLVGAPYYMARVGQQREYIRAQPWYTGKAIPEQVRFITGGWLTIHTRILQQHDWPPADFNHNGGDMMLGHLCVQQGYELGRWTEGLFINADDSGKCSSSKRRGASTTPIGADYKQSPAESTPTSPTRTAPNFFDILDGKHAN